MQASILSHSIRKKASVIWRFMPGCALASFDTCITTSILYHVSKATVYGISNIFYGTEKYLCLNDKVCDHHNKRNTAHGQDRGHGK